MDVIGLEIEPRCSSSFVMMAQIDEYARFSQAMRCSTHLPVTVMPQPLVVGREDREALKSWKPAIPVSLDEFGIVNSVPVEEVEGQCEML